MAKRVERVNELIKEVVSEIVLRDTQFPDGVLVTVTRVDTSSDLHYANVFITIFASKKNPEDEVLKILKNNTGSIQRSLNRKLRMRPVPRIIFLTDQDEARRERIEKLISKKLD